MLKMKKLILNNSLLLATTLPLVSVVSCGSSFTSSFTNEAIANIRQILRQKADFASFIQAGFVSANMISQTITNIKAAQNFGFQTRINSIQAQDVDGQLTIGFELTKGSQIVNADYTITGFKTNQQVEIDNQIKPAEFFNLKTKVTGATPLYNELNVKSAKENEDVQSVVNQLNNAADQKAALTSYIDVDYDPNDPNKATVLKKTLAADESLKILEIKAFSNFGLKNEILLKLAISKNKQVSSPLVLKIVGFQEGVKKQLNKAFLSQYANQFFNSIASPIEINDPESFYLDKKASQIKTKSDLVAFLQNQSEIITINDFLGLQNVKLKATLKDLVANSANDAEGFLKAKFDFQIEGLQADLLLQDQEINLFGFQLG